MVDNCGKRKGVAGTASGCGGCGQLCLDDHHNEMELHLVSLTRRDDG